MKILIKNCNLISMDDSREKYEKNIDILISDKRIEKIDKNINVVADKIIDATDKVVMPGLINVHSHIPMSLFKETVDGYTLQEWLNDVIWPRENKLTDEEVYNGSIMSFKEMIRTGTTTAMDMYFMQDNILKAAKEMGVRLETTRTLMDINGKEDAENRLKNIEDMIEKNQGKDELITVNAGPHALYTCGEEYFKKCVDMCNKYKINMQMHFCENSTEVQQIKEKFNVKNPVEVLKRTIGNTRTVLAHCVKLSDEDIKMLKDLNVTVAHCPISNLKLGCGIARIADMVESGINVALGTDGQGSGSNMDLFEVMKYTALLQKGICEDPTKLSAYEVLKMATINGAKAMGMDNNIGSLIEGKVADLIIIDMNSYIIKPINDVFASIVYNVKGSDVDTTIINGKILMENKKLL